MNKKLLEDLESGPTHEGYSGIVRTFAATLSYYSPRAYKFVREAFSNKLPHPRTIRKWISSKNGEPGISEESIELLKIKADEAKSKGKRLLLNLIMDEMAIRRKIEWVEHKKRFVGQVQMGKSNEEEGDNLPVAKESLVFLVTCANENWKLPIAYFFVDSLTADEKKNILDQVLISLHNIDAKVLCITCDGPATNLCLIEKLGCNISNHNEMKTHFTHDLTGQKIYVLLDPMHMVKLQRNALSSKRKFIAYNSENPSVEEYVEWKYIEKLNEIQTIKKLHLANKLRNSHVYFKGQEMKTKLALQTFSRSVSVSLGFLRENMKIPEFQNCEGTQKFLLLMNDLIDIFNSRGTFKENYKKPLCIDTFQMHNELFEKAEEYLLNLKLSNGTPILDSTVKTGFLGFLIGIHTFRGLYEDYVLTGELDYIATYRNCQDHIELYFSQVRACGGFNNNPSALHFTAATKKLMLNNKVSASVHANCNNFDNTQLVFANGSIDNRVFYDRVNTHNQPLLEDMARPENYDNEEQLLMEYVGLEDEFTSEVVTYIAGFVQRAIFRKCHCEECLDCIDESEIAESDLIEARKFGNLITPSKDITYICKLAEIEFRLMTEKKNIANVGKFYNFLVNRIVLLIREEKEHIFDSIKLHDQNHWISIVKLVITEFLNLRLHHFAKSLHVPLKYVRMRNNKTTLFQGQ